MQIRFVRNFLVRYCSPQRVILLTLVCLLSSCSFLGAQVGEWCNTRAWISTDLESYVYQHFKQGQQARVGVVPFISQANLSDRSDGFRGLGTEIAWGVQRELLATEIFPIVQMLAQEDWPGRKQEFFSGNYGSMEFARNAGLNFLLIGYVDWPQRLDEWVVYSKLIDVNTGATLWYGTSTVKTHRPDLLEVSSTLGMTDRRPDIYNMQPIRDAAAHCIVHDMTNLPEVDKG
jgi:hypothetical protein